MRNMLRCTLIALALLSAKANALEWITMGPRAMGMGGAQVAIAQGPLASYYNPAGLGQLYNTSGLEIPIGARGEFTGSVVQGAKDLFQVSQDCQQKPLPGPTCTQANLTQALANLGQPGNGALVDVGGGVNLKFGRAVFFVDNTSYIGATPKVDNTNTTPLLIQNNQSKLIVRGGLFTEFGLGYGHEIRETGLMLGGNLKMISGRVGYDQINLVTTDPGSGGLKHFKDNTASSVRPGIDLGALWDIRETFPKIPLRPRVGIVSRNINNPTFAQPAAALAAGDKSRYSLHGQTRMGLALSPFKFWNLAADLDLSDNITPVDGYKSRYLSLGTEVNVFNRTWLNIPLRAGLQKNVSAGSSGLSYTAGFGFNFVHVMVDVAGMVSSKTTQLQSQGKTENIPNNVGASARFAFLFGGTDEGARNK